MRWLLTKRSTKHKAHVQQDALVVDDNVDKKESTSPARRLAVNDNVDVNNKNPARMLAKMKPQR